MKKIKLSIILLILLILTGCIKYDLKMEMETDKSFSLTLIDAIQNAYQDGSDIETNKASYEALGYEVEEYKDDSYTGLVLKKNYDNIDLISSADCGTFELTSLLETDPSKVTLFKSERNNTTTTYTADFTYDLTVESTSVSQTEETEEVDYSSYASSMYFAYSIILPANSKIISNNADEVSGDGYTLTWNMEYGKLKEIDFVFAIDDKDVTAKVIKDDQKEDNSNNKEEPKNEDDKAKVEETENIEEINAEDSSSSNSIIAILFAFAVILGLVALKLKTSKKFSANSKTDSNTIQHTKPPVNNQNNQK